MEGAAPRLSPFCLKIGMEVRGSMQHGCDIAEIVQN
jgi:hypothetical protein